MFFRFLLQRKLVVGLFITFIFLFGFYSISKLDKELFPEINFDEVFVSIETESMPALDVEQFIAKPVERALDGIKGVENYTSTVTIGNVTTIVEVEKGKGELLTKDIESAISTVNDHVHGMKEVYVMQLSTIQPYEFNLTVTGNNLEEASTFAKNVLKPRLEALSPIREVALHGLEQKEVSIVLKEAELTKHHVQPETILQVIQQTNINQSLGALTYDEEEHSIRWDTAFKSIEDINKIKIPTNDGIKKLSDLATVKEQLSELQQFAWRNGNSDFILVQVGRIEGASQVDMTEAVREEYEKIKEEGLPAGIQVDEIAAQADYVTSAIDGVIKNILIGAIIAIVVLLLFLRNVRATFIVGLSIPASILLTILVMSLLDYSFNLATLIGLGLGIGMMVDASIVVMESIYKKKEQGYNNIEAVVAGTKEVMTAVIASMLTTIVVFIPIGILENDMGQVVFVLAIVVAITLISSVLVSFTLIPAMAENFLKVKTRKKGKLQLIERYGNIISWLTKKKRNRLGVIGLFIVMFASSLLLITKIPMSVMPDIFDRYSEALIELEAGLTPEKRAEIAEAIHEELATIDEVEHNTIIDETSMLIAIVNMTPEKEAKREQQDISDEIFSKLRALQDDYPILSASSSLDEGGGFPVQLKISGEDLNELHHIGEDVATKLKQIEGISFSMSEASHMNEEMSIVLNEKNIEDDELAVASIYGKLHSILSDFPVGKFIQDGESSPIFLKNSQKITSERDLLKQTIITPYGEEKLSKYITFEKITAPTQIERDNGKRYTTVIADIEGRDLGAVNRDVQKLLREYEAEEGYSVSLSGDLEEQQEAATDLIVIFAVSLFLVFVVMAVQFNSLKHPIIILTIIPLTITGVILGLFLTQNELNIMSGIGIIMLVGIVLNNGILLIDRIKQLSIDGVSIHEAVIESGKDRIRPIFMTTLTTAGGMIPLALATDASSGYQSPLAVVIISGLLFATMITLVLIPAIYLLFEDIGNGIKRIFSKKEYNKASEQKETKISS